MRQSLYFPIDRTSYLKAEPLMNICFPSQHTLLFCAWPKSTEIPLRIQEQLDNLYWLPTDHLDCQPITYLHLENVITSVIYQHISHIPIYQSYTNISAIYQHISHIPTYQPYTNISAIYQYISHIPTYQSYTNISAIYNDNGDNDNDNILFDHNLQIEITIFNSLENQITNRSGD